jgi:predicted peroxiredoxin
MPFGGCASTGSLPAMTDRRLVVKATHAADDPERAHLACNVAAVAATAGLDVHLFLAVEGVRLALPDLGDELVVPDAPAITDLLDVLYTAATVTVCTPCASRRGLSEASFRTGTAMGGSAQFVELATSPHATALVY